MKYSRRRLLQTTRLAVAAVGLADCNDRSNDETTTAVGADSEMETAAETTAEDAEPSVSIDAVVAVAAEWNAMRVRLYDTVALAAAGRLGTAARVTGDVFAHLGQPSGEWGTHEQLEATSEQNYGTLESHLDDAREAYATGDAERGLDLAVQAADNLLAAQRDRVDATVVDVLEVLLFGTHARDAGLFTAAGEVDVAAELANAVYEDFEDASAHSSLESASGELYKTFEAAVEGAADVGDAETITASARIAADMTIDASYELAPEAVTSASHLALMQTVDFDAEMLAGLGGPGDEFTYAAALSLYRARTTDTPRLVATDEADFAVTVASDVFAYFEDARAHEVLGEADHDVYESFEGGLESLAEAAESGDGAAAEETVATVDENLFAGISALIGGETATALKTTFLRTRLGDARELVVAGGTGRAVAVGESLFTRFEESKANLYKSVEEESEELYHRFEEEHLAGLVENAATGNTDAAAAYAEGATDALFGFEATIGATVEVSATGTAFFGAHGFDAAALTQVGASARADSVVQSTFAFFESGVGDYHETLEETDRDPCESFEGAFDSIRTVTEKGGGAYSAAKTYGQKAVDSMYAVIATVAADTSLGTAASEHMTGVFQIFKEARIREALEGTDRDAYENFKAALSDYVNVLADGSEVDAAAEACTTATARAQLAVVGEVGKAPEAGSSENGGSADAALSGGPNVVGDVPEDTDRVVEMSAVAFEPAELTVPAGDTIAFKHVGDKAHSVTACDDELPEGATYWASSGFESREAAGTDWNEGKGAVQSGQSYVHTFKATGERVYYYVPRETAGMTGAIVVEG